MTCSRCCQSCMALQFIPVYHRKFEMWKTENRMLEQQKDPGNPSKQRKFNFFWNSCTVENFRFIYVSCTKHFNSRTLKYSIHHATFHKASSLSAFPTVRLVYACLLLSDLNLCTHFFHIFSPFPKSEFKSIQTAVFFVLIIPAGSSIIMIHFDINTPQSVQ